jgi:hypothetical protein
MYSLDMMVQSKGCSNTGDGRAKSRAKVFQKRMKNIWNNGHRHGSELNLHQDECSDYLFQDSPWATFMLLVRM